MDESQQEPIPKPDGRPSTAASSETPLALWVFRASMAMTLVGFVPGAGAVGHVGRRLALVALAWYGMRAVVLAGDSPKMTHKTRWVDLTLAFVFMVIAVFEWVSLVTE